MGITSENEPFVSTKTDSSHGLQGYRTAFTTDRRASKKRRERIHEQIDAHRKLLLMKLLSALGAPDIANDFCSGLIAALGYDDTAGIELHDKEFARLALGTTHWLSKSDWETLLNREVERRRKQRQRILQWQAKKTAPLLFEFDGSLDKKSIKKRRHAKYTLHFIEPLRALARDVQPGASEEWIDRAVRVRASEFYERFTGEARALVTKQIQSPESVAHRCATSLKNAMGAAATAIDHLGQVKGEQGAIDLFFDEFLSKLPTDEFTFLRIFEKVKMLQDKIVSGVSSRTNVLNPQSEAACNTSSCIAGQIAPVTGVSTPSEISGQKTGATDLPTSRRPRPSFIGIPVDDFIANHPAYQNKKGSENWRDQLMTEKQRDVLRKAGVYEHLPKGAASEQIGELIASGALCDFLSLAELQSFDPKAKGSSKKERRFCCPLCGGEKQLDAAHRSLSVNTETGEYYCHRCGTKGVLREFCETVTTSAPRAFPAPSPAAKPETSEKWREWVSGAKLVKGTAGADYLAARGIPADVAALAGVKCGTWWKASEEGDKPEPFTAVIFPMHNEAGQLVAAQARAITGNTKRTRGEKLEGVFMTSPNALKSTRVAVTEAPIDALALAAAGIDAIALCGTTGPELLIDALAGREVLIATDADKEGDKAAGELLKALQGLAAPARRFRPIGGKDWAEIAQHHGLASIEAQLEYLTGEAVSDEMHDFEFEEVAGCITR